MPIVIKDFTWTQTEKYLSLSLPLRGAKANNIDIINSKDYIKVSYPPYFFECWFYENVDDDKCEVTINNGLVTIKIEKLENIIWPQLHHLNQENKDLMKLTRENALNYVKEKNERLVKEKTERIAENKKIALKEQMKIEDEDRLRISNIKEEEKKKATEEIEKFKKIHKSVLDNESVKTENLETIKSTDLSKDIFDSQHETKILEMSTIPISKEMIKTKIISEPRSSGRIEIKFTPRVFPTPSRESQEQNEKEWLQKQMESRKLNEVPAELEEFSQEEMNVDWLKDKAGQFFKNGNYQSAISVYNHAIRFFPKVPAFYSNRAACHYQLRNLMKCVEDCSKALELLTPPVESNLQNRVKAHVRRGTAFCELELYAEGLMDYDAAIKLDPSNNDLKTDADNIRKIIQGN